MKTVERETKEMESIGYALRTMFGDKQDVVELLNRYDESIKGVVAAWQDCFNEAANAKCDLELANRKIAQIENKYNCLTAMNVSDREKYIKIREIVNGQNYL